MELHQVCLLEFKESPISRKMIENVPVLDVIKESGDNDEEDEEEEEDEEKYHSYRNNNKIKDESMSNKFKVSLMRK